MTYIMKKTIAGLIIGLLISTYSFASDTEITAKKTKASQYTKCASNSITTGLIKTAFNQQSDRESKVMTYGGLALALFAGWYTSPEYALSSYKEHQNVLNQDALKYIKKGSRDEIYKFTVSYLVPRNEKCLPLLKELEISLRNNKKEFDSFKESKQAKDLMDAVLQTSKEFVIGKAPN